MKKKIILRFLKNKAIEIGVFLKWAGVVALIAMIALPILAFACYWLAQLLYKSDWIVDNIFPFKSTELLEISMQGFIFLWYVVAVLYIVGVVGWFSCDWLKENWKRAIKEIEEESDVNITKEL